MMISDASVFQVGRRSNIYAVHPFSGREPLLAFRRKCAAAACRILVG
jgi:hypothetical protein